MFAAIAGLDEYAHAKNIARMSMSRWVGERNLSSTPP